MIGDGRVVEEIDVSPENAQKASVERASEQSCA